MHDSYHSPLLLLSLYLSWIPRMTLTISPFSNYMSLTGYWVTFNGSSLFIHFVCYHISPPLWFHYSILDCVV